MLVPHHLKPPISGKGIYLGIGYYWQLQKHPLFRALSRNLHETTAKQYHPFYREYAWEHARGPIMHSSVCVGGGGVPKMRNG